MRSLLLTCILLLSSGLLSAAEIVGSVILSMGQNIAVATDGSERVLKRQSEVYANDLLKTGQKGRLQLRFSDGSRLALKPSTEFRIAEYSFDEKQPEEGKAIFQLLKGGMRTISGQIGKSQRENYRLETTVATIGIRGTHYGVEYTDEGLYCETIEGAIEVTTKKKRIVVSAGEGAWLDGNGNIIKGDATGQTGDYVLRNKHQTPPGATVEKLDAALDDASVIPAADPELEGVISVQPQAQTQVKAPVIAPNPTGRGVAAPDSSLVAVAFTRNDSAAGTTLSANGSIFVDVDSAVSVDSSGGTGDLVTGISLIDPAPSISSGNCNPCIFSGGSNTGFISEKGNLSLGGANLTWGRWNAVFSLNENSSLQSLIGGFHFMYSDSLVTQAQLDALTTARSGSYLYTYSVGSNLTSPQIDTGDTGSLVGFGAGGVPAGRLYAGTYVVMNWDSLEIEQVSLIANVNDGAGIRNYQLTEQSGVTTTLNDVLQGGEMPLTGVCSGGNCSVGVNDTTMNGQMTFDLVGAQADGAITSFGASGTSPASQDITVVGTVLLDSSGPAP